MQPLIDRRKTSNHEFVGGDAHIAPVLLQRKSTPRRGVILSERQRVEGSTHLFDQSGRIHGKRSFDFVPFHSTALRMTRLAVRCDQSQFTLQPGLFQQTESVLSAARTFRLPKNLKSSVRRGRFTHRPLQGALGTHRTPGEHAGSFALQLTMLPTEPGGDQLSICLPRKPATVWASF